MQRPFPTSLDLIIPAHNEADVILRSIDIVSAALVKIPDLSWKIIIAENGSTDGTREVVEAANLPNVMVITVQKRGKGGAIKVGLPHAHADYFGFIDADISPDPEAIHRMLWEFQDSNIHLVSGSRLHSESIVDRSFYRGLSSLIFNMLARMILGVHANDVQCGLKIMDGTGKALLAMCIENYWLLDLELVLRIERHGGVVRSVPITWREHFYPERKAKLHVIRDGMSAIREMFRLRNVIPSPTNLST